MWQYGLTAAVTAAGEGTNVVSGGGTLSAILVVVAGGVIVIAQMFVRDYLDSRKAKRRHQEHVDARSVVEDLRRENARLHRENARLRRDLEEHREP